MNIALIGSGGREHVLCQKIYESKLTKNINPLTIAQDAVTRVSEGDYLGAAAYLLGHNPEATLLGCLDPDPDKQDNTIFPEGSVIVDPWRKCPQINGCTVVHYGNTRLGKK